MSTVVTDNVQDSGGSSLLGRRNAIINGNFGVNQRGVSGTVSLSAGEYGHDRWKAGASGATYTFSTSGGVTTLDISAGSLIQVVEDVNLVTDTYVLSFEGTAQGKIGGGSFGDSGVTGAVTGGSNLNIEFNTGTVSKVQLEVGNKPTPFEHRSFGEELALCMRYFQRMGRGSVGRWVTSSRCEIFFRYAVPLRIGDPTVNIIQATGQIYEVGVTSNNGATISAGGTTIFGNGTTTGGGMDLSSITGLDVTPTPGSMAAFMHDAFGISAEL